MKKREWLIVIIPLLLTWFVDRITKEWATHLIEIKSFGVLKFALFHNHGAMMGLFSDLPTVLRVVSLSTSGAFLLCTYALIQYLLPIKSLALRSGMSFLIGGIIGNVTDRIIWGYVVDFIIFGSANGWSSPAFNLADLLQWVGYLLIIYAIIKEGETLWPENNTRKKYWVNITFQLKYCFILMGVGLSLTLISLVFSYTYLRVTIQDLVGNNTALMAKFLTPFILTYGIICVSFCAILFAVGKVISHQIAGPLFAFERFLSDTLAGKQAHLKLRNRDEFKHLESLAEEIATKLNEIKKERTITVVEFSEKKPNE